MLNETRETYDAVRNCLSNPIYLTIGAFILGGLGFSIYSLIGIHNLKKEIKKKRSLEDEL